MCTTRSVPLIAIVLPDATSIPPSSIVRMSVPSISNTIFPWSAVPEAVAVEKCTSSAVLLEAPFKTCIVNDSVADVPNASETSALLASS